LNVPLPRKMKRTSTAARLEALERAHARLSRRLRAAERLLAGLESFVSDFDARQGPAAVRLATAALAKADSALSVATSVYHARAQRVARREQREGVTTH
jgi:paraquat-inducible protein B